MKKVILCAAALMIGGVALGQQVPIGPTAGISPDAIAPVGVGNMGHSAQLGTGNKVNVLQAGELNSVWTVQGEAAVVGENQISISQTGDVDGNEAKSGEANIAEARQKGTTGSAEIIQQGDRNNANSAQGLNSASSGNILRIQQGTGQNAEDNSAFTSQDGMNNQSGTLQVWDNSTASTVQNGNTNYSDILQNSGPENSLGHRASVDQDGNENMADVDQIGSMTNDASVEQDGNNNSSIQLQTASAGSGNTGSIVQDGNNNEASQNQAGALGGNIGHIDQGAATLGLPSGQTVGQSTMDDIIDDIAFGTPNDKSYGSLAFQDQTGSNNTGYIGQFGQVGTNGDYAKQKQSGDNNEAYIKQNRSGTATGQGNSGEQLQAGDGATAGLVQLGRNNKAYQRQYDNSEVLSTQRGEFNALNTYQTGGDNVAHTAQRGEYNQIFIVQDAGQTYLAQQNLDTNWNDGSNWITVNQYGPLEGPNPNAGVICDFPGPDTFTFDKTPETALGLEAPCPDCVKLP